jgi:hypothetical protein
MNVLNEAAGFDLGHKRWTMPETGAANEFVDVVIATIQSMRNTGTLKTITGYDQLAEFVSSQTTVQEALRKLLWKRKLATEDGTPKVWFGMTETDPLAPLVLALVEDHAHKALPDMVSAGEIPRFKVGFAVEPKRQPRKAEATHTASPDTAELQ